MATKSTHPLDLIFAEKDLFIWLLPGKSVCHIPNKSGIVHSSCSVVVSPFTALYCTGILDKFVRHALLLATVLLPGYKLQALPRNKLSNVQKILRLRPRVY